MKPEIPTQPPEGWALEPEGQGSRAGLLALLDRECAWVEDLDRQIGGGSLTKLALGLYRFLVFNEDENGAWREFMIQYALVEPKLLDSFTASFDAIKRVSAEKVIATCRKTLRTPLIKLSELLSPEVLPTVASKTLAEVLEEGIKKDVKYTIDGVRIEDVLDLSRLYFVLENEIALQLKLGLNIDEDVAQAVMDCLLEC